MNAPDVVSSSAKALLASALFACAAPLESAGLDVDLDEAVDGEVEPLRLLVSLREANLAGAPVEGATCAVERASRVPIETVTDARGYAHVELDGWPETLSVSCARGHVTSVVGLRASDVPERVVELELYAEEPESAWVALTGEIVGKTTPTSRVFVQASASERSFESGGTRYVLELRPGAAFTRLAIETERARTEGANGYARAILGWSLVSHRPLWADASHTLDLGEGRLEARFVEGSVGLPKAPGSVLRAPGFVGRVWTELDAGASPLLVGLAVESHFDGDERLDYRVASVGAVGLSGELTTRIELSNPAAPHHGKSELWLRGPLPEGALEARLLDEPEVLEPRTGVPLEGTRLRWSADGAEPSRFEGCDEGCVHHFDVRWPEGRSEVVLPTLPSRGVGLRPGSVRGVLVSTDAIAEGVLLRRSESWQLVFER